MIHWARTGPWIAGVPPSLICSESGFPNHEKIQLGPNKMRGTSGKRSYSDGYCFVLDGTSFIRDLYIPSIIAPDTSWGEQMQQETDDPSWTGLSDTANPLGVPLLLWNVDTDVGNNVMVIWWKHIKDEKHGMISMTSIFFKWLDKPPIRSIYLTMFFSPKVTMGDSNGIEYEKGAGAGVLQCEAEGQQQTLGWKKTGRVNLKVHQNNSAKFDIWKEKSIEHLVSYLMSAPE